MPRTSRQRLHPDGEDYSAVRCVAGDGVGPAVPASRARTMAASAPRAVAATRTSAATARTRARMSEREGHLRARGVCRLAGPAEQVVFTLQGHPGGGVDAQPQRVNPIVDMGQIGIV